MCQREGRKSIAYKNDRFFIQNNKDERKQEKVYAKNDKNGYYSKVKTKAKNRNKPKNIIL